MKKHEFVFIVLAAVLTLQHSFQANAAGFDDPVLEQEEIVVTATRIETPLGRLGSSVTVISRDEIEARGKPTVLDLLRGLPAIDVVQSGGAGSAFSIFIRGAKSEHTLVLLDGIEMNDPITPGRTFTFASLSVENIERIEILRGPQSMLYGSDAMGGVIHIITRKGEGEPSGSVRAEGGSFDTVSARGEFRGENGPLGYALGFSRLETGGISTAREEDGNREKDGSESTSASARVSALLRKNLEAEATVRYEESETDLDASGGVGGDDPNSRESREQIAARAEARLLAFDGAWEQVLGASWTRHDREYVDPADPFRPLDSSRSVFESDLLVFEWRHNFMLGDSHVLTLGMESGEEEGSSEYASRSAFGPYTSVFEEKSARTDGLYLQDRFLPESSISGSLGVRVDDHDRFGTETTYRLALSWEVQDGTRLKASFGTGFKAPSLYQLYSMYGDDSLDPETSDGWDAGVEHVFRDGRWTFSLTGFQNEFENLIDYDLVAWRYVNVARAETKGLECLVVFRGDRLEWSAGYTLTETEDRDTGLDLLRRPKHKATFEAGYRFGETGRAGFEIVYVGEREDVDDSTWPAARVELDAYTRVDLSASRRLGDRFEIFGRVENLFDEDYEEIKGYGTPGRSGYAGCKVEI